MSNYEKEVLKYDKCGLCGKEMLTITRKDNPAKTTKICRNKECRLYIEVGRLKGWSYKI